MFPSPHNLLVLHDLRRFASDYGTEIIARSNDVVQNLWRQVQGGVLYKKRDAKYITADKPGSTFSTMTLDRPSSATLACPGLEGGRAYKLERGRYRLLELNRPEGGALFYASTSWDGHRKTLA